MKNNTPNTNQCNSRTKSTCPLNGQCQTQDIIYKCTVSTSVNPDKTYLGPAEGNFEKRCHNRTKSLRNKRYTNDKSLSKCIWEIKETHQENPSLKWSTVKRVPAYSNIRCLFCLLYLGIVNYPHPEELLNKNSGLVSACEQVFIK